MSIKDSRLLKVVAAGAAVVMILGLTSAVTSAQRGPGRGGQAIGPGGPGGGMGPGMMGGPGMRGGRGGRGGPGGQMGMLGPGLRGLDLSDAQREQIRGVMESHKGGFEAVGQALAERRRALHDAITADVIDETLIRQHAAAAAAVQADQAVLQAKVHAEIFALLTAEQQQKAKALKAEAEKRRSERADRMRERRERMRNAK